MPDQESRNNGSQPQRIKLTARLSMNAYDVLAEIQRQHRRNTGSAIPLWKILDAAVIAYAKDLERKAGE